MTWSVSAGEEVKAFLNTLTNDEFKEVGARLALLRDMGPHLKRPHADTLSGSRHKNMKELRIPHKEKQFRILFAFDTERNAILLVGGDKVPLGEKLWYPKFIAMADDLYDAHENALAEKRKQQEAA